MAHMSTIVLSNYILRQKKNSIQKSLNREEKGMIKKYALPSLKSALGYRGAKPNNVFYLMKSFSNK